MDKLINGLTEEDFKAATNEPAISEIDLLTEIEPLLKDYFIGDFKLDDTSIIYSMLNGQKFKINVQKLS